MKSKLATTMQSDFDRQKFYGSYHNKFSRHQNFKEIKNFLYPSQNFFLSLLGEIYVLFTHK